jgi:hypothetical protein
VVSELQPEIGIGTEFLAVVVIRTIFTRTITIIMTITITVTTTPSQLSQNYQSQWSSPPSLLNESKTMVKTWFRQ